MKKLISVFSNEIKQKIFSVEVDKITEIRMRINCPLIINTLNDEIIYKDLVISEHQLYDTFNAITEYSAYAYENSIKNGFITLYGGHRVGIGGEILLEKDKIKTFKHISFLNFRISHFIKDCGINLINNLLVGQDFQNTLIISRPGLGKTTLLRDLIRLISENVQGTSISVIDERNEISGSYKGIPFLDLGYRTDVIVGTEKTEGIMLALRSLAPKIIAVDEVGSGQDIEILRYAKKSGVKILATIHGDNIDDVKDKIGQADLFDKYVIIKDKGVYRCY